MRNSECGMSWRTTSLGPCYVARPSTAIPHSTLRIPHWSPPHRSVLANALTPRDAARQGPNGEPDDLPAQPAQDGVRALQDRKSTRLNSSHLVISYAVFCLKKQTLKT